VVEGTEVGEVRRRADNGDVSSVVLKNGTEVDAGGLGVFIGQTPNASWSGADLDERGFVRTGRDGAGLLETSVPGVFAAGDVRSENKVHRVATAAGEGALAISQVHEFLPRVGPPELREAAADEADDAADRWMELLVGFDHAVPYTLGDDAEPAPDPAVREAAASFIASGGTRSLGRAGPDAPGTIPSAVRSMGRSDLGGPVWHVLEDKHDLLKRTVRNMTYEHEAHVDVPGHPGVAVRVRKSTDNALGIGYDVHAVHSREVRTGLRSRGTMTEHSVGARLGHANTAGGVQRFVRGLSSLSPAELRERIEAGRASALARRGRSLAEAAG
jgi:hypothetical protein